MRDATGELVKWKPIGSGTYNVTTVSDRPFTWHIDAVPYTQRWIIKTRKCVDALNHAKRAVELWNEINPEHPAVLLSKERSWMAPFIPGRQASDELIQTALINIYKKTGRIVWDGCGDGNMLELDGGAFCVDVDQAFSRHSPTSKEAIKNIGRKQFNKYWEVYSDATSRGARPKSVATIQTLIYLEKQLPDEDILDKYLTVRTIDRLYAFREHKLPISKSDLNFASILNDKGFENYLASKLKPMRLTTTVISRSHPVYKPKPTANHAEEQSTWGFGFLKFW